MCNSINIYSPLFEEGALALKTNMKWYDLTIDNAPLVQLAFNLSNGVTDTLESSSILIYLEIHMGLYTQKGG